MKKKILLGLLGGLVVLTASGCDNGKTFTITCEGKKTDLEGIQINNKTVYNFNNDQIVTDYKVTSVSTYDTDEKYKQYKEKFLVEANKGTANVEYSMKVNDSARTINFEYKVKVPAATKNNTDDYYKATKVLERAEKELNAKCTIKGIEKDKLK